MDIIIRSIKSIHHEIRNREEMSSYKALSARRDVDKATVIQNIKQMGAQNVPVYKCRDILMALLYVVYQGTQFTDLEANEIFFCLTQLFTKRDPIVKRLLHISIKELAKQSNDAIVATSSLIKDISSSVDFYKPSAMRALVRVTDKAMVGSIERYLKQSIVSRYSAYVSASLVSSYCIHNPDMLKKWASEITQALESGQPSVEYHALGVSYLMRCDDKYALIKMLTKYGRSVNSPMAVVFMIRVCVSLVLRMTAADGGPSANRTTHNKPSPSDPLLNPSDDMKVLFGFLSNCLNTRSDIIGLEACRACIAIRSLPTKIVKLILNILKMHSNSYKSCVRFAAVRSLYDMIIKHSYLLDAISKEMKDQVEFLTNDDNKSICVYAIIMSLKLSPPSNLKKSLKQCSQLMKELNDEFRIEVIKHMAVIASKHTEHGEVLLKIFDECLRNEGGFAFKNSVVSSIVVLLRVDSTVQKACVNSLCEYLEDCEYSRLSIKIIRHIGVHIGCCANPSSCVRYIFNRVLLDKTEIRLAAVRCLAHIAGQYQSLTADILVLLQRCMADPSDNIRMEADMYYRLLNTATSGNADHQNLIKSYLCPSTKSTPTDIDQLRCAVSRYLSDGAFDTPCDVNAYNLEELAAAAHLESTTSPKYERAINDTFNNPSDTLTDQMINNHNTSDSDEKSQLETARKQLAAVGDFFDGCGQLLSMSKWPSTLTEIEAEYVVKAVKYVFDQHLAIEFLVKNTVKDIVVDEATFEFTPPDEFTVVASNKSSSISFNEQASCYSLLKLPIDPLSVTGYCTGCRMKFKVKDIASNTTYEDFYDIEDVPVVVGDYVTGVETYSFDTEWNSLGSDHDLNDGFLLDTVTSIESAVDKVTQLLALNIVHDAVVPASNQAVGGTKRVVKMFGDFKATHQIACILEFSKLPNIEGVTVNAFFRSSDPLACEIMVSSLYS